MSASDTAILFALIKQGMTLPMTEQKIYGVEGESEDFRVAVASAEREYCSLSSCTITWAITCIPFKTSRAKTGYCFHFFISVP
ncbi:hypothetical protein DT385_01075 [Pseudomonas syringae]